MDAESQASCVSYQIIALCWFSCGPTDGLLYGQNYMFPVQTNLSICKLIISRTDINYEEQVIVSPYNFSSSGHFFRSRNNCLEREINMLMHGGKKRQVRQKADLGVVVLA